MVWFNDAHYGAWKALRELSRAQSPFLGEVRAPHSWPSIDVWAGEEGALLRALMPGVDSSAVEVKIHENVVTLTCEWPGSEGAESRTRDIRLPFRVDASAAVASFKRGVFELRVPRHASEQPRHIEVKSE